MRKLVCIVLLTLTTTSASALNTETKQLLATIAMPLAVEAVSRVTGVPQNDLATLVSTLNQANVPAPQFVDVMRYTPVALTDGNGQPFVAYVQNEVSQGVTGDALASAILQQLQTRYNLTPQPAASTFVVEDNYIPPVVLTRLSGVSVSPSDDAFTIIALPLAVAAVADIAGVPQDQLANFVAALNNANVPPAQMIEVVRYVPVALIDEGQPFVQFVQTQASQGVTGPALVPVIERRLRPFYPATQINIVAPPPPPAATTVVTTTPIVPKHARFRTIEVDQNFVPPVVMTRVAEVRARPHGGPPGQIKKQLGLQTGAEVVDGEKGEKEHGRGRGREERVVVGQQPVAAPAARVVVPPQVQPVPVPVAVAPGKGHGDEGKEQGNGKGKGKGKDKGKD